MHRVHSHPTPITDVWPSQDIIRTAFENGINMFDTAEEYSGGKSEEEMCVIRIFYLGSVPNARRLGDELSKSLDFDELI